MAQYGTINQKQLDQTPGTDGQFLRRMSGVWVPYTLQPSDVPASVRSQLLITASRTLAASDAGRHLFNATASSFDLIIPNNTFAANDEIEIACDSTGLINILAGSGFTINGGTAAVCFGGTAGFLKFRSPSAAQWYGGSIPEQTTMPLNKASGFWHWTTTSGISNTVGISGGQGGMLLYSFANGTGASVAVDNTLDTTKLGILNSTTGTTATGRGGVSVGALTNAQIQQRLQSGSYLSIDTLVRVPTLSVAASEAFRVFLGWSDSLTPSSGNMALVHINENNSIVGMVCAAGVTSTVPLGTVTANQWMRLRMTASSTGVRFQLNNNPIETITTNIPTAGMAFHSTILKILGTTSRTMQNDYHLIDIGYPSQF
jgi:hypothetical protein